MWSLIASRVAYIFKLLVNRVRPALENIPAGFLGLRCVGVFLRGRNDFNARQRAASLCGRTTAAFKKPQQIRGLNQNHNHEMKRFFKSTAMSASRCAGPLQDFYAGLLAKGMKPDMARLTLARKIAAITLTLWKKGERFDAEHLKSQAA